MLVRGLSWMVFVAAISSSGCKNPNYCEGNPNDDCRAPWDAGPDVDAFTCTSSTECATPTPVCDTTMGTCVQCLAPDDTAACTGTTPVCDDNHTCRACEAHSECPSQACLPDGSCAQASDVAYVSAAGTGTACTQGSPCPLLADAIAKDLPYVKIAADGAAAASATTVIDGKAVTILAEPGASIDRQTDGAIIEVRSAGADVAIYDLTVTGATGDSGYGIQLSPNGGAPKLSLTRVTLDNNQGGGIFATGGTLTVAQSTITGNQDGGIFATGGTLTVAQSTIAMNQGGGISVSGAGATFNITNSFIYRNGDPDNGLYGGVNLGVATAGSNVFQFNTVVDNRAAINSGGVICNVAALALANNVIARNSLAGSTTTPNAQTFGDCTYPTSVIQNDVAGLAFEAPDPPGPFSYRLLAGSTAIDQATTPSTIVIDHEGDARPNGPQKDCGADEYVP